MVITDAMVTAAYNRLLSAINDIEPCGGCAVSGNPDACSVCGGSGFIQKYDGMTAMRLALEAADDQRRNDQLA